MRKRLILGSLAILCVAALRLSAADTPAAPLPQGSTDREAFNRMVQEEVRRQLPEAVQAEVKKQISELINQSRREARANSALSTLKTIRSMLELYKIQHSGQFPALKELVTWNALLAKTDAQGSFTGNTNLGPYLQAPPVNPFSGRSGVVAAGSPTPAAGWSWDEANGQLRLIVLEADLDGVHGLAREDLEIIPSKAAPVANVAK